MINIWFIIKMGFVEYFLITCALVAPSTAGVPLSDFFPHGVNSDSRIRECSDSCFGSIPNIPPFPFALSTYRSVFVGTDGYISFNDGNVGSHQDCASSPAGKPMITPFWVHIETSSGAPGRVYYQAYNSDPDDKIFSKAAREIAAAYPSYKRIKVNWALVATWVNVSPYRYSTAKTCNSTKPNAPMNTFQVVLATDGTSSFAIFLYNNVTWITGVENCQLAGDTCGMPTTSGKGTPAKFGFDTADGKPFEGVVGLSCEKAMSDIDEKSNVGKAGKFIFKIDGAISVERCNDTAFLEGEQALRISPSFVSAFGHHLLQVQGPCFSENWQYFCTFHDEIIGDVSSFAEITEILDTPTATCNVPYLYTKWKIAFSVVAFNSTRELGVNETEEEYKASVVNVTFRGELTVVEGAPDVVATVVDKVNGSVFTYNINWKPSTINTSELNRVDLQLVFFNMSNGEWQTHKVYPSLANNGSYQFTIDSSTVPSELAAGMVTFKIGPAAEDTWLPEGFGNETNTMQRGIVFHALDKAVHCINDVCKITHPWDIAMDIRLGQNPIANCMPSFLQSSRWLHAIISVCKGVGVVATSLDYLPILSKSLAKDKCDRYYQEEQDKWSKELAKCPPLNSQAQLDPAFIAVNDLRYTAELSPTTYSTYRSANPNVEGVYQKTNYDSNGQVIIGFGAAPPEVTPGRYDKRTRYFDGIEVAEWAAKGIAKNIFGRVIDNFLPQAYCCRWSFEECKHFFDKRPASPCKGYQPPRTATARGDPHIQTLDGLSYTFNGAGEFWLIRSSIFIMQARMEVLPPPSPQQASVFTAFVMKSNEHNITVQIELSQSQTVSVQVNDQTLDFSDPALFTQSYQGCLIRVTKPDLSEVVISFANGFSFTFDTAINAMAVIASADFSQLNGTKVLGLLGNLNGNPDDDLTTPDGNVVTNDTTNLHAIHYDFGLKWAVAKEDTLFSYEPGKSWSSYWKPSFTPKLTAPSTTNAQALEVCGSSTECLFDFESTCGNLAFANQTKNVDEKVNNTIAVLELKPAMCDPVLTPENGYIQLATAASFSGSQVTFECLYGYNMTTPKTIACDEASLNWTGPNPAVCERIACPELQPPENGYLANNEGHLFENEVRFACHDDFHLVGQETVVCQIDGQWNGSVPTCERNQCENVTAPLHGRITGSTFVNDTITFSCYYGYRLNGTDTIRCESGSKWSHTDLAVCDLIVCSEVQAPENGYISVNQGYHFENKVTFACIEDYHLVGDAIISCQLDGQWTASAPFCDRNSCATVTAPTNGTIQGSFFVNDTVTFTCDSGYRLNGVDTIRCESGSKWSQNDLPVCDRIICPELQPPENGYFTVNQGQFFESEVGFACLEDFHLVGQALVVCQKDDQWNGSVPHCERNSCENVTAPNNGAMQGSFFVNDTVTFTCNHGYKLNGTENIRCESGSKWSPSTLPVCDQIICPQMHPPDNGFLVIDQGNLFENEVTFGCFQDFHLVGNQVVVCQFTALWNGSIPICERNKCANLTAPTNGLLEGSYFVNDTVTITCQDGYYLNGTAKVSCLSGSQWNSAVGECLPIVISTRGPEQSPSTTVSVRPGTTNHVIVTSTTTVKRETTTASKRPTTVVSTEEPLASVSVTTSADSNTESTKQSSVATTTKQTDLSGLVRDLIIALSATGIFAVVSFIAAIYFCCKKKTPSPAKPVEVELVVRGGKEDVLNNNYSS